MKKIQFVFLLVFVLGCSSGEEVFPVVTPNDVQMPSAVPTQTVPLSTQTLTPISTFTATINPTAIGGVAGRIAFTSEQDGVPEIYVINPDGSGLIRLANEIIPKFSPAWSPDGTKIAFGTNTDNAAVLYIMNIDGSNPTKLIDTEEISAYDPTNPELRFENGCCNPVWSLNGTKIAFKAAHYIGCCSTAGYIHMLGDDGSYLISIPTFVWENPAWSPDSQKIVLGSDCDGLPGICVMNADGTNPTNLSHEIGYGGADGWPVWSPDGKRIAFTSGRNGDGEVYVMNSDGSNQINLTNYGSGWDGFPIWSPDGHKITFSSYRDNNWEIYVMNADGTNTINITNHPAGDSAPIWSPDSTKIAFVSDRDGNSEIYVVDVDGNNLLRLTNNDAKDYSPAWSP